MTTDPRRAAVLALHWQVNVIKPEGFFGAMLAEPVARSGVVARAAAFHEAAGLPVFFTRFTIPEGEGLLVRNTAFMAAVGDAQEAFRPDAPGAQLIPEMAGQVSGANDRYSGLSSQARRGRLGEIVDNQKLSGLAGSDLAERLARRGIDTLFLTGVATNLTVEQTARHGTDLGFFVYTVADCVAAAEEEVQAASLDNLDLATAGCLSAEEVLARLAG